jgi:hypothetical protein
LVALFGAGLSFFRIGAASAWLRSRARYHHATGRTSDKDADLVKRARKAVCLSNAELMVAKAKNH